MNEIKILAIGNWLMPAFLCVPLIAIAAEIAEDKYRKSKVMLWNLAARVGYVTAGALVITMLSLSMMRMFAAGYTVPAVMHIPFIAIMSIITIINLFYHD